MEVFRADASSTATSNTALPDTTVYPLLLNKNLSLNGLPNEEQNSSNSMHNIIREEGNIVFDSSEHDFVSQHNDGLPVITSIFSLASRSNEVKRESHNLKVIDNPFTHTPLITQTEMPKTFNSSKIGTCNYSPVVSSFVVKRNQDSISSQTWTTEENNKDMNPDSQDVLTGCHITPSSDNILSNLLRGNDMVKEYNCHAAEQPLLVASSSTSDATQEGIMRKREQRIHHLKDLLLKKKAEVEKIRFLSKKNSLSSIIDKLKDRLSTRTDALENQTYVAHPQTDSKKRPPKVPNLDLICMHSCGGLPNLVLDGNVGKETNTKSVENTKCQNNEEESSDHPNIIGGSRGHQKKRRGRPKKMFPKSNITTNKTKRLAGRNKKDSSYSTVRGTNTFSSPAFVVHSYCDTISAVNCSRSNMPPPTSTSASLNHPDHYSLNPTYINRASSIFPNYPVHLNTSIANVEFPSAMQTSQIRSGSMERYFI